MTKKPQMIYTTGFIKGYAKPILLVLSVLSWNNPVADIE